MLMALRLLAQVYNYVRPQPNHPNRLVIGRSSFQYNMLLLLKIILPELQKEVSLIRVVL